jgi:hypothetical protein
MGHILCHEDEFLPRDVRQVKYHSVCFSKSLVPWFPNVILINSTAVLFHFHFNTPFVVTLGRVEILNILANSTDLPYRHEMQLNVINIITHWMDKIVTFSLSCKIQV